MKKKQLSTLPFKFSPNIDYMQTIFNVVQAGLRSSTLCQDPFMPVSFAWNFLIPHYVSVVCAANFVCFVCHFQSNREVKTIKINNILSVLIIFPHPKNGSRIVAFLFAQIDPFLSFFFNTVPYNLIIVKSLN